MPNAIETLDVREIQGLVRHWVKLLAAQKIEEAVRFLHPLPERAWSVDELKTALGRYSRQYRNAPDDQKDAFLPRVTDPGQMDREGENMVIYTRTSSGVLAIDYDIPIEGSWSDLTASFVVLEHGDAFSICLRDLHVL
jgi:hypothetical protein